MTKRDYLAILQDCTFYNAFIENCCAYRRWNKSEVGFHLLNYPVDEWINFGFHWSQAVNRQYSWVDIHMKWKQFIASNALSMYKYLTPWYKPHRDVFISIY